MKSTLEMIKDERGGVEMTYTTRGPANITRISYAKEFFI